MGQDQPGTPGLPPGGEDLAAVDVVDGSAGPVIRLAGEIDMSNADAVRQQIVELAGTPEGARTGSAVVVDLSGLRFIDSSAISALVQLSSGLTDAGRRLVLVAAPDCVAARTLRLVGLDRALNLQDTSEGSVPDPS